MKKLPLLAPRTLGEASGLAGTLGATHDAGRGCWRVSWADASGREVQAEAKVGETAWSAPASVSTPETGNKPAEAASPAGSGVPEDFLVVQSLSGRRAALRSGRRVVGRPPRFPSASLVFCGEESAGWCDLGFVDEPPEQVIGTVALAAAPGHWLAAYLVEDHQGRSVCRVAQLPREAAPVAASAWRQWPSYPQPPGVAGIMAGQDGGVLIAAGGANFPELPPWEGGKKKYYDAIYVLLPGEQAWRPAGRLPTPRAYGATVSVPEGVLIAGGEDSDQVFQDSLLLHWDGEKVQIRTDARLPAATTSAVAVVLDGSVYLAGGYAAGAPRVSQNFFWRRALAGPAAQWQALPTWPGPTRALAVAAAVGGAVYLISGIEIRLAEGKTPPEAAPPVYLQDAYRYRPGSGWERLPNLPWSAIAAPSPAPVTAVPARVFVLGGVDGRQVGHLPRATALPDDVIYFDAARNEWRHWAEAWPKPIVCSPAIETDAGWIVPSGESMAGHRTTEVWAWRAGG